MTDYKARCEALETALRAKVAEWRRQCALVRAEISPGGIRERHPEGPRYGIAAVESCADDIEALLSAEPPAPKEGQ